MATFLILAHAPLATALKAVAGHVYAECAAGLMAMDVPPDANVEHVAAELRQRLGDQEVLILADIFGATPCNAARRVADGVKVRLVAGVNVPMLWRTLCYRDQPLDDLVKKAVEGGGNGVMHVPPEQPPQFQSKSVSARNDQDAHHHQQ